jgi:hypothetical protein
LTPGAAYDRHPAEGGARRPDAIAAQAMAADVAASSRPWKNRRWAALV